MSSSPTSPDLQEMNGVLEAQGITKAFPGVRALENVSLQVRAGRVLLLLGANGAGKSTLMNIFAGVLAPDCGQLRIDGSVVKIDSPRKANAHGIATIFQELSLAPNLTVAENVFLGREPRTRLRLVNYDTMNHDTRALLARLEQPIAPDTLVQSLRVGQRQVVEIARALSIKARVLIMDEPTSALSQHETGVLLKLIAELKGSGVAIIYITHKFEELIDIGDDVAIMRDGRLVAEAKLSAISTAEIVRHMVGHEPANAYGGRPRRFPGAVMLRVDHASLTHPSRPGDYLVRNVHLHVARGEVLGIFGLMGAGRTELLETIFGLHSGRADVQIAVEDQLIHCNSATEAIAAGLALAPEDRKHDGLLLEMSSRENASLVCLRRAQRWGLLSRQREAALIEPLLTRFNLSIDSLDAPVRTLSGGNQQKVVIAKWLATMPKVLLLDEPTRGIDINAKNEIYALIDELARSGLSVILVSSELSEVLALSDRILVMCEGLKTAEFLREDATAERLMKAALSRPASSGLKC